MALVLPRPSMEWELYYYHRRDIQIGADGSIVRGDSLVYILRPEDFDPRIKSHAHIQQIAYFHGMSLGVPRVPVTQIADDIDDIRVSVRADEMIGIAPHGFVVRRVRHLQVRLRLRQRIRRATKYNERMIAMGILLATVWRRLHRTA